MDDCGSITIVEIYFDAECQTVNLRFQGTISSDGHTTQTININPADLKRLATRFAEISEALDKLEGKAE